jgi:hypothetical protein
MARTRSNPSEPNLNDASQESQRGKNFVERREATYTNTRERGEAQIARVEEDVMECARVPSWQCNSRKWAG